MRELDDRIERAVGGRPVAYRARGGGYTTADRYSVTLDDGRRVFVKSSDASNLAAWLRREHEVYEHLRAEASRLVSPAGTMTAPAHCLRLRT